MPVSLGDDHYLSKSAARKLLVAFNRSIRGTKDEPRTIRGISKMSAEQMENKLKEFSVRKKKSGDVLTHKQVISKRYTEKIPANTRMKKSKSTKDAPSKTMPGKEDYTGKKGDIKKSAGKDVAKDNKQKDFEPSTQPKKTITKQPTSYQKYFASKNGKVKKGEWAKAPENPKNMRASKKMAREKMKSDKAEKAKAYKSIPVITKKGAKGMSLKQLRVNLKARKIKGYSGKKKSALLEQYFK